TGQKITKSIACYISKDLRPYSVVENAGFKFMIKTTEPKYVIPSRQVFTEKAVPELYNETKAKVAGALAKATRTALTCDAWTSRATQAYVTFTAHYITDAWQLESRVLQTRAMHESHTAVNMNELFHSVAHEWKLKLANLVIVTDNAANMLAAAQMDNSTHIKCFEHTLNLAAQRAMKLNSVFGRIRRITGFFHRSSIATHALQEKQRLLQLQLHKLKSDAPTRWNSDRTISGAAGGYLCRSPQLRRCGSSGHTNRPRNQTGQNKTILYTASTLDPRFKALPFLAKDEQLDISAKVIAEAAALQKEVTPGEAENNPEKDPESDPEEGPAPKKSSALFNLLGKTLTGVRVRVRLGFWPV
ncbi:E3 SUMO-protein ligase ZBED1-like, partial [Trachinotus anak]|uniref:E3 SUMO-protein ligase ZBED1-like n=1 Tax=Trachinotus anak TaxID=443729 RepID=UPI0039F17CA9